MRAMVFEKPHSPLKLMDIPTPQPQQGQILIQVHTCGICRTDLHIIDGELPHPKLPLVLGHQIIGKVIELGTDAKRFKLGDRVGIPWLGSSCGTCDYCRSGRENLCDKALYTGYQIDGGCAEYAVADERFAFPIPPTYDAISAAPLLCAGLIGYRALRIAGEGKHIGFYGFGASAHLMVQIAVYQKRSVYAFTRKNDRKHQEFARELGAAWAGDSETLPPHPLDAAIIFAPEGQLVPQALRSVRKGGIVVCAGIHMSDIPSFPYSLLWEERAVCSVANLTRRDGEEFLAIAPKVPVRASVTTYPLEQINNALEDLRFGNFSGAGVILVSQEK